ncbi:MAG: glycosyltransferase family 2 protein [Verrucomicrobiales bacterium]|nr:glycosyltransferase family 2 protein [Verrucomicrobiales bacterium]MCP5557991.1 glycosyltransferase family 2 protein [Verrucomicrobiaceae bacterium]
MPSPSRTHLILIPSYNTGPKLIPTVRNALDRWSPVWVVVDGSTDDSAQHLEALKEENPQLKVMVLPENGGKGTAVLAGLKEAVAEGFTHVLTMDADGQHAADSIEPFMAASMAHPDALVLGLPQFDESAPTERLIGRSIANWFANLETLWAGIGDCLFGLRVYPAAPLLHVLEHHRWARRFDFDPEVAIRLVWRRHPVINMPSPCRYFNAAEGGVSHFKYLRDNVLITWMYFRLLLEFFIRLPVLILHKLTTNKARAFPS